jgi:1-deoxy-D-xylulose-5-phosphate synthase
MRDLGVPQQFHAQGSRSEVFVQLGLTAQDVARMITEWAADRLGEPQPVGGQRLPAKEQDNR